MAPLKIISHETYGFENICLYTAKPSTDKRRKLYFKRQKSESID